MDFELSPYPAVVLVLEGESEMLLVPRVMDMLGVGTGPGAVRLVKAGGATKDLQLLAEYAVTPELGEDLGVGVELARPPVRFVVAMDPEEKFASEKARERRRQSWVRRIYEAIPRERRTEAMRDEIGTLVEVRTWNARDEPFEFANWTDEELAAALTALCERRHGGMERPVAPEDLMRLRAGDRNLDGLWQRVTRGREKEIPKVGLAEALWPALESKVRHVLRDGSPEDVPAVGLVWHVDGLVRTALRSDAAIRR